MSRFLGTGPSNGPRNPFCTQKNRYVWGRQKIACINSYYSFPQREIHRDYSVRPVRFLKFLQASTMNVRERGRPEDQTKFRLFRAGATVITGGVTRRPETMCPRTNVLGPLVPKLIVPCDTMSLD